jgi:two-component system nitrogen regulation response regulator GlnG
MRRGRFEQADGGTLFLDEIGDMPFDLQTRLLRVLSDGQFYRVGGHQPLKSNVRVIAATHQNLEERVRLGGFREDLFHRLNVIRLRLPALRERREDIPTLARFFLQKSAKDLGVEAKRISEPALARLAGFDFPGNVRQLENICHWLTVMAPAQVIETKDLPPELLDGSVAGGLDVVSPLVTPTPGEGASGGSTSAASFEVARPVIESIAAPVAHASASVESVTTVPAVAGGWLNDLQREARERLHAGQTDVWDALTRQFEAQLIHTALELTRGRRIEAAQKLGIGRNTITRKIQELGIDD